MNCIHCGTKNTQVENSRETNRGEAVWRRRRCAKCGKLFSTYERPGLDFLVVEKRDGKRTRYLRYKLFASIYDAIMGGKRKDRGSAANEASDILSEIEKKILDSEKHLVKTSELVDYVTEILEVRDLGACYRYAAFAPFRGMKFGI